MKPTINKITAPVCFLIIFIITVSYMPARSGIQMSVSGFVRDAQTKMPLSGVTVYIFRENQEPGDTDNVFSGTSDNNGYYKIRFLDAGKYSFSIEIPGIGTVQIGMIANDGSSTSDYYDFEITEGRNKRLNIFLGTNAYPYIERNDNKLWNEINFTMLYVVDGKEAISPTQRGHVCNNMEILEPGKPQYISDETVIIIDGKEKSGIFKYQRERACNTKCKNGKCDFDICQAKVRTSIELHGAGWLKKKHPNWSDELIACQLKCLQTHEMVHYNMFIPICCEEWNNFLDYLKNSNNNICCKEKKDCDSHLEEKLKTFWDKVVSRMKGTETNAVKEQQGCISEKCSSGITGVVNEI